MKELIFNTATSEKRAALLEAGELIEVHIEQPDETKTAGDIYIGRVKNVVQGMQAAFVDIGREKNGFLYRDELLSFRRLEEPYARKEKRSINEFITEGQLIIVQAEKEEFGEKGARLTENLSFAGKYSVFMPNGNYIAVSKKIQPEAEREAWRTSAAEVMENQEGVVIRTNAASSTWKAVKADIMLLKEEWAALEKMTAKAKQPGLLKKGSGLAEKLLKDYPASQLSRIVVDNAEEAGRIRRLLRYEEKDTNKMVTYRGRENVFSYEKLDKPMERLLLDHVWLKNGASLKIDKTEALTVIDVNTARFTGKTNVAETIKQTNLEAAKIIAKELRLRDIAGIIVIDFIDMKRTEDKEEVADCLKQALKSDRALTNVLGISRIGLLEMTRKKTARSLHDRLFEPCRACHGSGKVKKAETIVYEAERLLYEYREVESEAALLSLPHRAAEWLEEDGRYLLDYWKQLFPFSIWIQSIQKAHPEIGFAETAEEAAEWQKERQMKN